MKYINGFTEVYHVHRAKRSAWIVCAHLLYSFSKSVQHLRAFMPLPDLRLVQRKAELLSNRPREAYQPIERVDEPNQLPQLLRSFRHSIYSMPKIA